MTTLSKLLGSAALLALTFAGTTVFASEQTELLANATKTAENMQHDQSFEKAQDMLKNARGVLIVPGLVKAGFVFGAEGGDGVLLQHNKGGWSQPAFYGMGSASFGLQIGIEKAQIVMMIMSEKALHALEQNEFKVGAGAGLTVVTLSAGAEGATSGAPTGDIVVWTSATGAYGGLTLNGSVIKPRDEWNAKFYGRQVSVPEILSGKVRNPEANGLRDELSEATSHGKQANLK